MPHDPYKALYIHIPFCVQRCNYCDFCTRARDFDSIEIDEYIEKVIKEIRTYSKNGELDNIETIYIGGGTPSFIGNKRLSSLLYAISLSLNLEKVKEFSMEANPESITENMIKDIWALGVNRISLGVQSFDDEILNILGRAHSSQKAVESINLIKSRFKNISIDLMCGIPGQSLDSFKKSLEKFLELDLPHISIYPLSIEYNTVFYKWSIQGRINKVNEDDQAEHMELACEILEKTGYSHYEVASYAKPGYECAHNLSYWQSKPYLGIGQSATTMTQNSERRMRVTDEHVEDNLDTKQMLAEDLMLAMRTKYGITKDLCKKAINSFPDFDKKLSDLQSIGLIKEDNGSFVPTKKGWLCGNDLYSSLLSLS